MFCWRQRSKFLKKAFESLYGGQFTLSTQLIKPKYSAGDRLLRSTNLPGVTRFSEEINLTSVLKRLTLNQGLRDSKDDVSSVNPSLWQRATAWNTSFLISLRWPLIHIINPVDKTKLTYRWLDMKIPLVLTAMMANYGKIIDINWNVSCLRAWVCLNSTQISLNITDKTVVSPLCLKEVSSLQIPEPWLL